MRIHYLIAGFFMAVLMQGCLPKYEGPAVYNSQKVLDKQKLSEHYTLVASQQTADLSNYWLTILPVNLDIPIDESDIESTLVQKLLQRYDADILTDVKFDSAWMVTYYWNVWTRKITADVWKRKEQ